jgi:hypothetical protein
VDDVLCLCLYRGIKIVSNAGVSTRTLAPRAWLRSRRGSDERCVSRSLTAMTPLRSSRRPAPTVADGAVDEYIETYGLEDVICYASDYPHLEGGKDPMGRFSNRLAHLGSDVTEKFFVHNGKWILPD